MFWQRLKWELSDHSHTGKILKTRRAGDKGLRKRLGLHSLFPLASMKCNECTVWCLAKVGCDRFGTLLQCTLQTLKILIAVVAHRKPVSPNLLAAKKSKVKLDGFCLASGMWIVESEPVVVMITALAIIVLLENGYVPLTTGD